MAKPPNVVVVGGGHNGLTAAAYLARAGVEVTVLERLDSIGGAAVSSRLFAGIDARLSRYSYLVSLLPQQIIDDLGLRVSLARRRFSSYTPRPGTTTGLLVDNQDAAATEESFAQIGAAGDAQPFAEFYRRTTLLGEAIFPTMTSPLPTAQEIRAAIGGAVWSDFVAEPIGDVIERTFSDDLVRGVVATDGLIGTFASVYDDLAANQCFLYHVIGGATGDWDVPIGGMGAVTAELERVAREAGARIVTNADVRAVSADGEVRYVVGDREHTLHADLVLSNVALATLAALLDESAPRPEGAQVKANLLLRRLPRLRSAADPVAAFGGTFHVNESLTQLEDASTSAAAGKVPDPLPLEIYCHSLTDRSILGSEFAGAQTITVFGLHTPDRLVASHGNDNLRAILRARILASLDSVLGEPIEPLLYLDAHGAPCMEVRTTADIEASVGMPGGNIFHGPLQWPWLDDEGADSPAARWGVATSHDRILLCGAGARRGGGVSGIGGQNAAMAALEILGLQSE
ncbi:FAD-dependent oxidoreductase [Epidermidibacterium keratini]|uniref:FAD-dependent oxidoreductase n=1 Tax=Epidermidibacterium keratini TaxID=1891644 RepID=A0A7L4YU25_9ACTN|nr:FAD-dependent oxidoreductase [Epidermidibacterium keratini]